MRTKNEKISQKRNISSLNSDNAELSQIEKRERMNKLIDSLEWEKPPLLVQSKWEIIVDNQGWIYFGIEVILFICYYILDLC